jgi:hypothetical protein
VSAERNDTRGNSNSLQSKIFHINSMVDGSCVFPYESYKYHCYEHVHVHVNSTSMNMSKRLDDTSCLRFKDRSITTEIRLFVECSTLCESRLEGGGG